MPLLKNNQFVEDDFVALADDAALPADGSIIISLSRLTADWMQVSARKLRCGLRLGNTDKVEIVARMMGKLALIILPFPAFGDGRSYSLARQLRLDGYKGELRAEGNVLPDQLQLMRQVGFDSFAVSDRFPLGVWQAAPQQMSLSYQRGLVCDREVEVWSQRHRGINEWEVPAHGD